MTNVEHIAALGELGYLRLADRGADAEALLLRAVGELVELVRAHEGRALNDALRKMRADTQAVLFVAALRALDQLGFGVDEGEW